MSVDQLASNLSTYKEQLQQVRKLLNDDPGNAEYADMEKELEEVILIHNCSLLGCSFFFFLSFSCLFYFFFFLILNSLVSFLFSSSLTLSWLVHLLLTTV